MALEDTIYAELFFNHNLASVTPLFTAFWAKLIF